MASGKTIVKNIEGSKDNSGSGVEKRPPPEERFYINLINMGYYVIDQIKALYLKGKISINPELIEIAMDVIKTMDKNFIIQTFIKSGTPYWDMIYEKNEAYFRERADKIFEGVPINLKAFRDIFEARDAQGNKIVEQSIRDMIWKYFHSLVRISINYMHEKGFYTEQCDAKKCIELAAKWQVVFK